ncbi:MAG: ABC transporter permease [bacterium]|nr:ABC transporter permease [bacterium]
MLYYLTRRFFYMIGMLALMSVVAFVVVQLPPGDYVTSYIANESESGERPGEAEIAALRQQYGLDLPIMLQYFKWIGNMFQGNFGMSFQFKRPVTKLIAERLPLTLVVSISTLLFTYLIAITVGIYSATHQYSFGDYTTSILGFIGLATPNFLLALILMLFFNKTFGISIGGLFSVDYQLAPWNLAKVWDLVTHLPIPIIVIGTAGTAGIIRVMRGCLLDELRAQYVTTARAKGVAEKTLLFRYPVRVAVNPIISTVAWVLPAVFSGSVITATVLGLPTMGPMLLQSLKTQDTYLSGAIILLLCALTVLGTLISDILLVIIDPRIKFEKG